MATTKWSLLLSAGLAAVMLFSIVGTALANPVWGDFTTDEDNENNFFWGGADGDLDGTYAATLLYGKNIVNFTPHPDEKTVRHGLSWFSPFICAAHAVSPIEFDIYVPRGEMMPGGKLTLYTYWVSAGDTSYVYLNGNYLGTLAPTGDGQDGATVFDLPAVTDIVTPGRNNLVQVVPYPGTCTDVKGGTLHLISPRSAIAGEVFVDANGNGALDEGEVGLPGATVHFFVDGKDINTSLTTGDDGTYGLVQVEWGDWNVTVDVPAGYVPTTPTARSFRLENVDKFLGVNFGIATAPTPTPTPKPTKKPKSTPTPA
ncbi:MAG: hypothetical protein HY260_18845 [Chloroflexi bacterium]|nr:hypothetical protein [Chloroflexota bacterium]